MALFGTFWIRSTVQKCVNKNVTAYFVTSTIEMQHTVCKKSLFVMDQDKDD